MKHTTIKQTLTTLCILSYITLSAQLIDRFPHTESFEGTIENSSWGPICDIPQTCNTNDGSLVFSLLDANFMSGKDGDQFVRSYTVNETGPLFTIVSSVYDFSCINDANISFLYACNRNFGMNLEISLDGGITWEEDELWDNGAQSSTLNLI